MIRHGATERYYARFTRHGKQVWKSLGTTLKTVADGKLAKLKSDWLAEESAAPDSTGKWTVGTAHDFLLRDVDAGKALNKKAGIQREGRLAASSQLYRRETVAALLPSWQEVHGSNLRETEIRRLTADAVERWAFAYRGEVSAGRFNAALGSLRRAFRYAREAGQVHRDPRSASSVRRCGKANSTPRSRLARIFFASSKSSATAGAARRATPPTSRNCSPTAGRARQRRRRSHGATWISSACK